MLVKDLVEVVNDLSRVVVNIPLNMLSGFELEFDDNGSGIKSSSDTVSLHYSNAFERYGGFQGVFAKGMMLRDVLKALGGLKVVDFNSFEERLNNLPTFIVTVEGAEFNPQQLQYMVD